ncbi:MAG TPA: long-chain fatty acid--CoA ligase [Hyphomicrobium sp.]|jgi:long-chain acyl-CoA synthetase|uniref:long-chain-fatty-acid--CoA ligase n=1 Tax=Hyphomicrobium sp. TaxID=82 RepID=UPI002C0482B8|nr:long-chain fatty acid--CoA ligase [Hyphomicrobium sp.]HXE00463.1 long-chain fatty acid--CoA ligase [Hyphomicrobium sp.]
MTPEAVLSPASTSLPWAAAYPASVDWHMPIPTGPVPDLLDRAARQFPDNPAISFFGRVTRYADLAAEVDRVAAGLQKIGVKRGSKIGIFLPNTPTFIVYYFAILKAGGTVVNFNPLYTLEELAFQARDSETEIMVTHDLAALFSKIEDLMDRGVIARAIVVPFAPLLPPVKSVLFRVFKRRDIAPVSSSRVAQKIISGAALAATAERMKPVAIDPAEDVAVLQYTGGTTGTPKGAMLTHANLTANTAQIRAWAVDLEPGKETILGALPLFHVFALTVVMNIGVDMASKIILMPRFQLLEALKLIHRERPTMMPAVPTIFTAMLNCPNIKSYDLSSLRFCISGGAPLPVEIKLKFETVSGSKVVEGYGLSEASPVLTCNPITGEPVPGSIGPPVPGTIISLRDIDDPTREVPQGERGELCAKGPQIMKGYWKKPAETEKQFVGDFLRTGDVAIMDERGFFSIVDRIKDLIICSGYNVYPRRIEEAIYEHPAVEEVTVIGIPDAYRGEAPKAFIKLKTGMTATAAGILKHLELKISKIELPAEIEFRDSLPKTLIGKLSKKELAAEEAKRGKRAKT